MYRVKCKCGFEYESDECDANSGELLASCRGRAHVLEHPEHIVEYFEIEELGKEEERKCEHDIEIDEYCEKCRKEEISGLIGMMGRDKDDYGGNLKDINLFDEEVEIAVIVISGGIEHEIGFESLDLSIDDFEDIDVDDENAADEAQEIALEKITEVVEKIAN